MALHPKESHNAVSIWDLRTVRNHLTALRRDVRESAHLPTADKAKLQRRISAALNVVNDNLQTDVFDRIKGRWVK